jgi:hypothetical protein
MPSKVTVTLENTDPQKVILEATKEIIDETIKDMVCPKHGDKPVVEISFSDGANFGFDVYGCCRDFTEEVRKKINDLSNLMQ